MQQPWKVPLHDEWLVDVTARYRGLVLTFILRASEPLIALGTLAREQLLLQLQDQLREVRRWLLVIRVLADLQLDSFAGDTSQFRTTLNAIERIDASVSAFMKTDWRKGN